MQHGLRRFLPLSLALTLATPGLDAPAKADPAMIAGLEELARGDLRVATIGYRLAVAGLPLCKTTVPLSGLLIQDLSEYATDYRPAAIAAFGLDQGPTVEAVVPGSPAARAGLIARDVLTAIDDRPVDQIAGPAQAKKSFARAQALTDALDAAMAKGPVRIDILRDRMRQRVLLTPQPGCVSHIQLVPSDHYNAGADGHIVTVSTGLLATARNDDELAFVLGHEMSHNILGHRVRLEGEGVSFGLLAGFGGNAAKIRRTEEEADYLGVYLVTLAGYDPNAAPGFWKRFDHEHGFGIFADATHLKGDRRVLFLQRAADEALAKKRAGATLTPDIAGALARF